MGAPVVHFEIAGKDGGKLQKFYADIFDWEIDSDNPIQYGMVAAQTDKSIGGGITSTQDGGPGYATFYIEVPDVNTALSQIEAAGGKIILPETTIPNMVTFAMFNDPEGNLLGLVKSEA
jgi:predicted enzyme related to lactoylglutathione lyase